MFVVVVSHVFSTQVKVSKLSNHYDPFALRQDNTDYRYVNHSHQQYFLGILGPTTK